MPYQLPLLQLAQRLARVIVVFGFIGATNLTHRAYMLLAPHSPSFVLYVLQAAVSSAEGFGDMLVYVKWF